MKDINAQEILRVLRELNRCLDHLARGVQLSRPEVLQGSVALIAHGAWHLGAVRQLIGMIKGD